VVDPSGEKSWVGEIESWELGLVKAAARRIRTTDRDELESELARHLLRLKRHPPSGIRNWRAFVNKALRNKAVNWIRDQQAREERLVALDKLSEEDSSETLTLEDVLKSPEPDHDLRLAFARAWEELDPQLRSVWELLLEEKGKQVAVARRLGKHRNTVRLLIRRIQQVLQRHRF
jgi:RNA polymerase sigma factor (sigma-70 family)